MGNQPGKLLELCSCSESRTVTKPSIGGTRQKTAYFFKYTTLQDGNSAVLSCNLDVEAQATEKDGSRVGISDSFQE